MTPRTPPKDVKNEIDYSMLQARIKHDRTSAVAITTYSVTLGASLVALPLWASVGSLHSAAYSWIVAAATVTSVAGLGISLLFLNRRSTPASTNDLLAFAESNAMTVSYHSPVTQLQESVHVMYKYATFYPPNPWYYAVELAIEGSYKDYAVQLYDLTVAIPAPSLSSIEEDLQTAQGELRAKHSTMTLTISAPKLLPASLGVVTWALPGLSPEHTKELHKYIASSNIISDIQTDGTQLAILLTTKLPHDRDTIKNIFHLLDYAYDLVIQ